MKILALDIGAGTEDILLYDVRERSLENCIKMVLPSPSQIFAAKAREATKLYEALFIYGDTIGGGAFAFALLDHVQEGLRVVMTERAAYTLRNDLDEVRELGIQIVSGENEPTDFDGKELRIEEVNLGMLQGFLKEFDKPLFNVDVVAVAVQDHGLPPKGMSNRRFRIQNMKELLKDSPKPEALAFKEKEAPSYFLRMKSAALASRRQLPTAKVLIMETSPAAIFGCLKDPVIEKDNPILVVNVGNA
ncbi:hypothetical protein GWN63_06530, partial [Candidatus Bathyarchaeota archaeon]|nr:hypothetical protein [Candidatus Bathyarchaeota archaeon]NIU81874.1 hypothetical protein [Candidatus Bathyarchaeota archaeon]NIV68507.1 hypothetical protein [Candidatus Bathyarchaeota archaeon]NIW16802.1 hypothetical protein [Candidatus Bathyarchaeota archaeon]